MILVTVHTYNGSCGDEVQLLGIYSDGNKAKLAVYGLMKYYIKQYLNFRNIFPGRIEDEGLNGSEALENLKTLYPNTYEQVSIILNPEFWNVSIDRTCSIEVDDVEQDFYEKIYSTDLPSARIASYLEY